jgi:hypothetical protein
MRARLAPVVALLTIALVVPPAEAKPAPVKKPGPIRTRSKTTTASGHGAILSATATCPGKTKAISGGFLAPPIRAGGGALPVVYESLKAGPNAWRASAQLIDITSPPAEAASLTAFVYCRKNAPKSVPVAASLHAEPTPLIYGPSPTAACPAPLRAVAGGFTSGPQLPAPPPANAFVTLPFESYRIAPGIWRTGAVSGTGVDGAVTTFAYCSKSRRAPKEATARGIPATASQAKSTVDARCAKGKPISGGFSDQGAGIKTGAFYPYESRRAGRAWRVSALSQGTGPLTFIAHAYCA